MARFAWVKIAVEMPRDHKLYTRPLLDRHLWTCLLCHAQEHFPNGVIEGASAEALNSLFNLGSVARTQDALAYFVKAGLIEVKDDFLKLVNFARRQARQPEDREALRLRQQRYRNAHCNDSHATVTPVTVCVTRNVEGDEEEEGDRSRSPVSSQDGRSGGKELTSCEFVEKPDPRPLAGDVNGAMASLRAAAKAAGR